MSGHKKARSRGQWSHIVSKVTDAEQVKLRFLCLGMQTYS